MKYAVDMGSGVMIYVPSFIKICSGIEKLMGGYTERIVMSKAYFNILQNKESRLKIL
jgi:hypothetical protein